MDKVKGILKVGNFQASSNETISGAQQALYSNEVDATTSKINKKANIPDLKKKWQKRDKLVGL
jgi:hypothetical protein